MSRLNKDKQFQIICGLAIGLIFGFLFWLALAPYEQVAWFYGYPHKVAKETRYMEIRTVNGKADTTYIVKQDSEIVYKNYKQAMEE
jgi:hypothetical protein